MEPGRDALDLQRRRRAVLTLSARHAAELVAEIAPLVQGALVAEIVALPPRDVVLYFKPGGATPTLVRRGATLGAGAVILCGIAIGEFAFVAAGAVVTRDVPPYTLVAGNPASARGWVCRCGVRLRFASDFAVCGDCGAAYEQDENGVRPSAPVSAPGTERGSR